MEKRIGWIDNARGLCMLFVMAHHSPFMEAWMVKIYLPIFLTLFFFISGYLFVNPNKSVSIQQKALNIFTSLLIPYCIYILITSIFNLLTGGFDAFIADISDSLLGVKSWFVSALIVTELLGLLILFFKVNRVKFCIIFISISLAIYILLPYQEYYWNFRNAMFANLYFGIGMICRQYNVVTYLLKNIVGVVMAIVYVCLIIFDIAYNVNTGNFNETFTNYPFFIIETLIGIPAFIWLCSKITHYNKGLLFIGANSLLYYYFQSVFIRAILTCLDKLGLHFPNYIGIWIFLLFICVGIAIPVYFINKYFPIFSGKYRIKIPGDK